MNDIYDELLRLNKRLTVLENKIISIDNNVIELGDKFEESKNVSNIQNLRIKHFSIDPNIGNASLKDANINADITIFKKMYIDDIDPNKRCIRYLDKNIFQYWKNDQWINDVGGEYIKKIVMKNIQSYYLTLNLYNKYKYKDSEDFLKNQVHIHSISTPKYKNKLIDIIKNVLQNST